MDEHAKRRKDQAAMLEAADAFVRGSDAFLASTGVKPGSLRVLVPYALYARMMQLGRAITFLASNGYAEEAKPLARAILSTAITLKLITVDDLRGKPAPAGETIDFDKESDARALAYLSHHTVIRRKQNQGYLKRGWVDKEKLDVIDKEVDALDVASLADYAKNGITPSAKLGPRTDSWHGLSDEAAAGSVGVGEWYDLYYRPFSEESHGSEPASRAELERLLTQGKITLGPQFDDPYPVLRALVDAVGGAVLSLNRHFGLGKESDVRKIAEPLVQALSEHANSMEPVAWRRMMTP